MSEIYRLLQIYQAPSGQWSGRVIEDGQEVAGIAGCASADEVEATALEQGWRIDNVDHPDNGHYGMRADGEVLTGIGKLDLDNTDPGQDADLLPDN